MFYQWWGEIASKLTIGTQPAREPPVSSSLCVQKHSPYLSYLALQLFHYGPQISNYRKMARAALGHDMQIWFWWERQIVPYLSCNSISAIWKDGRLRCNVYVCVHMESFDPLEALCWHRCAWISDYDGSHCHERLNITGSCLVKLFSFVTISQLFTYRGEHQI